MSWTSPRTWVAGETVTAALMNTHVRDNLKAIGDAWTSYTPTLAQGTATDIAKTVNYAKYVAAGKLIICQVKVSATAAGDDNNAVTVSLPVAAATSGIYVGSGAYSAGVTGNYRGAAYLIDTGKVGILRADVSASAEIGIDPNIAVASGDVFYASFMYEAA